MKNKASRGAEQAKEQVGLLAPLTGRKTDCGAERQRSPAEDPVVGATRWVEKRGRKRITRGKEDRYEQKIEERPGEPGERLERAGRLLAWAGIPGYRIRREGT